jgi:ABC-type nitrate/sulfonate/bicarbonate transport system ATPase subunit
VLVLKGRPSSIEKVIEVDLPHPRSRETLQHARFLELRELVWSTLMAEAREAELRLEG